MKKTFLTILAVATALVACQKNEQTRPVNQDDLLVRFNVEGITDTYTFQTKTPIANGTHVGLFADAPVTNRNNADGTVSIVNETKTITGVTMYWGVEEHTANFWAVYPYNSGLTVTEDKIDYEINNLEHARDFLTAHTASAVAWKGAVTLPFKHPFTQVTYVITNSVPDDVVNTIVLSGVSVSGKVNIKTGAVSNLAAVTTVADECRTLTNVGQVFTYNTVIMPQGATPTLTVTMHSGAVYTYALNSAFTFAPEKHYTANIEITGSGHSQSSTDRVAASFSFTTADWSADNSTLNAAEGTQGGGTTAKWWFVEGSINSKPWEDHIPMVCREKTNDGVIWEATITYTPSIGDPGIKIRYTNPDSMNWDEGYGLNGKNFGLSSSKTTDDWVQTQLGQGNIQLGDAGEYKIEFNSTSKYLGVTWLSDLN